MNSTKGLTGYRSWAYHPLEFAVSGEPGSGKSTLVRKLTPLLGPGIVSIDTGGISDPDSAVWAHLDASALLVDNPLPGVVVPRVHLCGPGPVKASRVIRQAPPVAVAGPGAKPRRLPWAVPWFSRDDEASLARFIQGYWDSQLATRPLVGLVLTGGRSALLGYDKAALTYGGRSQVERVFDLVSRFCSQTWISCRKDQAQTSGRAGLPQVYDRYLDRGPLGGILSALDLKPDSAWLVVACDQPFLDEGALGELVAARDPRGYATVFRGGDGLPHPLCAIYEPKSRLRLHQTWALGYPCPRKMLVGPGVVVCDPSRPLVLFDVNTPRQDEEARRVLGS